MPIQVDVDQRRRDIAEATFAVAARDGLAAVTLRSVAAELGGSTTAITNYLPTRTDLLVNAVDELGREWIDELSNILAEDQGPAALRRMMRAAVTWDQDEHLRCIFWVALLTARGRNEAVDRHLADTAEAAREVIESAVTGCGHPTPRIAADMLFLFAQGVFVSIVETPGAWPVGRLTQAADLAVDSVLAGAAADAAAAR